MTTANGADSLQRRVTLRQVEHIYMDIGKWTEALNICLEIVGCVDDNMLPTRDTRQEDCAVDTMDDIAKILMALDEDDKCTTWLMKAAACALSLWSSSMATVGIIDLLLKYKRIEHERIEHERIEHERIEHERIEPNVVSTGGPIPITASSESSSCLAPSVVVSGT
ncbi:hypothetical protein GGR55DRAFT_579436 [Xylaria sp. FL0064]|nr:hypothetical protein GGR55DRAFT_579436 [Xylaria sp. FL0064]